MKRPAAFMDFQGTLGGGGTDDISTFEFFPFSIEAIRLLNKNDILVIGITNQSHIAKGELTMEAYELKLQQLQKELKRHDAYFDKVYCCPHMSSDNCKCKKPLTGMVERAKEECEIDMQRAYVIGDMGMSDMLLAKNIDAKGVLVLTGVGKGSMNEFRHTWKEVEADFIADHVLDAAEWIIHDLNLQEVV